eukprot:11679186-Alexandrium_andersonii.AAC.1
MNPCQRRGASLTDVGMCWCEGAGAFAQAPNEPVDEAGSNAKALSWLGYAWKMKQGAWCPSDGEGAIAHEKML